MRTSRGYTLVALMIGLTIMAIFRVFHSAECFRGFRRRYGRYPNTLKEMYEVRPRTLRKLWKDPITNSANWGLVSLTTGVPLPGTGTPPPPGGGAAPTPAPTPQPTPGFGAPPATTTGPVIGVYSLSKKKAFRLFNGRDVYDEWKFTEQTLMNQGPQPPAGPPGPGIGR